jgi:hypothetical protein
LGTGSFYSAFLNVFGANVEHSANGFEIDPHYGNSASILWKDQPIEIHYEDFTKVTFPDAEEKKATLLICNPPYVRHHHIEGEEKKLLNEKIAMRHGISLSGLSGLYCYFMCLSKDWMAQNGLAAWLVPSEFMDVKYGTAIKEFLVNRVSLIHIHRFLPDDAQFSDALVSSAIVWFRNQKPTIMQNVKFSLGGPLCSPTLTEEYTIDELREEKKWTSLPRNGKANGSNKDGNIPTIGDFFDVKRGIATGANEFFVMSPSEAEQLKIPDEFLIPILPSPRYLKIDRIESGSDGIPKIDKYSYVFSTDIPEDSIRESFPNVWKYLEEGRKLGVTDRYICRNRTPWYSQEKRKPAPILCTYMGRTTKKNGKDDLCPFRFILNKSKAIAANVYLMLYPKPWIEKSFNDNPELVDMAWQILQSIPLEKLVGEGRIYGGGLHKIEPKELLNAPTEALAELFSARSTPRLRQMSLF